MKTLFIGFGKVTQALAARVAGAQEVWEEQGTSVLCRRRSSLRESWQETLLRNKKFEDLFLEADVDQVFLSPGVDPQRPFFKTIESKEVRELDYFCEHYSGLIIGVTGTNGKSTFCLQLGEILKRAGKKVFIGGNLGNAMAEGLDHPSDVAVIEVSSFQSERLKTAPLDWAVLLNLQPDHLDRYPHLEDYYSAKWNLIEKAKHKIYPRELSPPFEEASLILFRGSDSANEILSKFTQFLFKEELHLEWKDHYLDDLPRLPHRLEEWEGKNGQTFINDSKATNVESVRYALRQLQKRFSKIHLLVGGKPKGDDYSLLLKELRFCDEIYAYGEARQKIARALSLTKIYKNLRFATKAAVSQVQPEEALLLSPACSSYDEFKNFEDRGEHFYRYVEPLLLKP